MTARSPQVASAVPATAGWEWLQSAAQMAALLSGSWPVSRDAGYGTSPGAEGAGAAGSGQAPVAWTRSPLVATRIPAPVPQAVAEARAFTLRTLRRWGASDCADDVAAVVSELLTNALRHGLPAQDAGNRLRPIRLGLLHPGPCVLCAVADSSDRLPIMRAGDWQAETGRGLRVVAALSHQWGYCPAPGCCGKVVWATVLTASRPW